MNSLRSIWNQMPAVRLLIPFIAGIWLCIVMDATGLFWIYAALVLLSLSIAAILYVNALASAALVYKWRYASGVAVFASMLSLAYVTTFFNTENKNPHHIASLNKGATAKTATYTGIISDPVVIKEKTVSALIELSGIARNDSLVPLSGKVVASIIKNDRSQALRYGDKIIFKGEVTPYDEPKNPGQFDYRLYQSLHHIYHRAYLQSGDWRVIDSALGNPILAKIYRVRTYFLSLIIQNVKGANELAVATAIMLGYRDYNTDEVTRAYTGSGVLHVLSVSGLHVAVLYYVLNILLGWMDKKRKLQIAKAVLVIIMMLFYAVLTGLSPPVLRSVWMFILIVVARLLDRDVSTFNVLGVSCLLLLICDPYYIADVGFQLSYIAVAGIVYLYPLFHKPLPLIFNFRKPFGFISIVLNYLLNFAWGLACVSIAAQIATCPISLYYFHSFPNFFLLSNLFVIPLSNFVLISGMALFAVGWQPVLQHWAGWIFNHLLICVNHFVFWVDALPYAVSPGIVVSFMQMILLYMIIAMTCWFIAGRRPKVLLAALVLMLVLCASFSAGNIKNDNLQKLIVYNAPNKKAIAFILHRQVYYDFDSAAIHDPNLMRYDIKDYWSRCGIESIEPADSAYIGHRLGYGNIFIVANKKILVIDDKLTNTSKLQADVVILSANNSNTITAIYNKIDFKELVFDTSNKPWRTKGWIEECNKLHIRYHDCRDHAFELDL
jgi:competence protein ComEC